MDASHITVGDLVTLNKAHPCGENLWRITRTGADIGLQCQGCRHAVMISRAELERKLANKKS